MVKSQRANLLCATLAQGHLLLPRLIRLAARRERPNGFAIKLEQRSPKPAFVLPEHFESSIHLNFLAADNVVALKTSCHFLFSGKPPAPLVKCPLRRSLLERIRRAELPIRVDSGQASVGASLTLPTRPQALPVVKETVAGFRALNF